jgi:hypothetical protein
MLFPDIVVHAPFALVLVLVAGAASAAKGAVALVTPGDDWDIWAGWADCDDWEI